MYIQARSQPSGGGGVVGGPKGDRVGWGGVCVGGGGYYYSEWSGGGGSFEPPDPPGYGPVYILMRESYPFCTFPAHLQL